MISTRQLRYFVEIADSGSFSAAAERLFVAQSALSRQIKELENQLHTPLFERTARQPRLTAAGEAFYPRARNLLSELHKASEMATQVGNGQVGTLRLSHSSTVPMSGALLRGISTWLERCPGVSMDIAKLSSEAQLEEIADGRLDVGLLRLPVLRQREGVRVVPLYSEQLLLAVPPNHALARCQAPVESAQLKDEAFISVPHPQRGGLQLSVGRVVHACRILPQGCTGHVAQDHAVAVDPGRLRYCLVTKIDAGHRPGRRADFFPWPTRTA